jgi:tape measure domain-containing protein
VPGAYIDEAWVLIGADFSHLAQDMQVGLTRAFAKVEPTTEKVGEGIERVFEEAAHGSNESLGDIGGPGTFTGLKTTAERAGEGIERAFDEAQRGADEALGDVGGPGLFAGVRVQAAAAGESIERSFREAQTSSSRHLRGIGIGLAAGAAGLVGGLGLLGGIAAKLGLQTAGGLEQAQIAFEELIGSAKGAQGFLADLNTFAAKTPFELPGLIDASRSLLGAGAATKDVIPTMTALGNATGALGLGQDAFARIMLATTQAMNKGKVANEELLQITEAGLPVYPMLAEALGKPVAEIQKLAEQGKLNSDVVLPKLYAQLQKNYGGAMERQSRTLVGVWSTFKDTVSLALSEGLEPLLPMLKDALPKAGEVLAGTIRGVSGFFAELIPRVAALWQDHGPKVLAFFRGAGAVIGAVSGVIADVIGWFRTLGSETEGTASELRTTFQTIWDTVRSVFTSIRSIVSTVLGWLADFWGRWGDVITATTRRALSAVLQVLRGVFQIIGGVFKVFASLLKGDWSGLWEGVKGIGRGAANILTGIFRGLWNTIRLLTGALVAAVKALWTGLWNTVRDRTRAGRDAVIGLVLGIKDRIVGFYAGAGRWLFNAGRRVLQGLWNGLIEVWNKIKSWFLAIPNWIKEHKGPLSLDLTLLAPAGRAIMQGFLNSLKAGGAAAIDYLKGIGVSVLGLFSDIGGFLTGGPTGGISGVVALGRRMAEALYGWAGQQWNALYQLWQNESGWNPMARNPSSGAFGIPQALPPGKMGPAAVAGDAAAQIAWGLRYIADRYGSPLAALQFWASHTPHWYDAGGMLPPGVTLAGGHALINLTGQPERIEGRRVVPPARGLTVDTHGAPFIQLDVHGSVDERVVPIIRRELDASWRELARLLRVGEVA